MDPEAFLEVMGQLQYGKGVFKLEMHCERYLMDGRLYLDKVVGIRTISEKNALKDDRVSRATAVCEKLVGHFSHSGKKKAALTEAQRELQIPEHNLITECPTRWGSKEMMIARVLEQAKAISQILSVDCYARSLIPTWQDIDVLESIHKALHPLLEFKDALSGEEYVSISYLKPVLHLLATSVLAEDAEDTDLTRSLKTKVLAYLSDKYGDPNIQELLDVGSFLDPGLKNTVHQH
ncbi:hypothetical protein F2P81_007560 [Scophthalmus maximus]|uniref:Uncharacterized protein n=1 Tax=Scophthalmus maximus TaxID=52904 RepID=A0A6A4T2K7_SCOMX|nr:hypothetical protein F2P81_007560 [Scophthalmus maximus]